MIITAPLVWFKLEGSYPCLTEITSLTSFLQGVPWCFFPKSYLGGYKIDGEVRETQLGYRATLNRRSNTTIYGDDIDEIVLDVEFQTDDRVRFKVMNELIWFRWACDKLCSNFKTCSGYTWLAWQEISNQISSRHCVFSPVLKLTLGFVYFHSSTTPRKKDMKYQSLCQVRHQRLLMQSILLSSRRILSPWIYCEKKTMSSCRWPQYFNCLGCFPDFLNFAFVCFASRRTGNREKLHVVKRKNTKHRVVY